MSGLFKSTVIKGNKLTEFAQTTATVGIVIPWGRGRYPVDGNVIWAPLPPKENRTVKRQGKGGVKQESFTYTLPYFVSFGKGPIYGFWWIKRNGKVVYTRDPAAPIEDAAYAAKWQQKVTLYYGTDSQMPDSTIESYEGTGRVSAHRGICGFVIEPDDVTEGGGAVPSYEAVVMASPSEVYFTSHPYDQYFQDASDYRPKLAGGELRTILHETTVDNDSSYRPQLLGGYLGIKLLSVVENEKSSYSPWLLGGILKNAAVTYDCPREECSYVPALTGGVLRRQLVVYDCPREQSSYAPTLTGGTLA